ncbi:carbon storage regulator [Legionella londiniensis]|uniref:Vir region protein n=1 Tax=Legionella londiniensis TaxID=45068 RepID=A0A0W0VSC7_9GAMM|nr:carbon storage regulator [Legionella londiniensis]KTD23140.1 vir region protein [Legionella londiniensis]STX93849.1 vir region protein [Legionella londiniensis]
MLILSRTKDQSIFIDKGQIQIKVIKVQGGQVHLGFTASKQIDIVREEIFYRNQGKPTNSKGLAESIK